MIFSFFFFFPPIFDRGFSLFLFSYLKHIHNLIVNEAYVFLGGLSVLSSEGKGKNSYPGSRFMAEGLRFWLKKACGRQDITYVRVFARQAVQG